MNSGSFIPPSPVHDVRADDEALVLARIDGAKTERLRHSRVYGVALASLRVISDDARNLGHQLPASQQTVAERIASSVDGVMESLRDMKPKFA